MAAAQTGFARAASFLRFTHRKLLLLEPWIILIIAHNYSVKLAEAQCLQPARHLSRLKRRERRVRAEVRIHQELMRDVAPVDIEAIARRERIMQAPLQLMSALIRLLDGPPPDNLQYSR